MLPLPRKRPKTAAALRRRLNWWSPLFFAGIQITHLSDDFMHCRARLRNWFNTKNTHGSQFGILGLPLFPVFKYTRGMVRIGDSYGYVHTGNGSWFPLRIGCPPEIACFRLERTVQ